ncbi:histidine kinase [Phyllobacterium phragmitis]|uniref:histidine kinase n=1 Tax=Phyllobacterium phragmitis TaxID=2670329 RepID=A0A2S9IZN2_9HYPH|nr:HAMP domain-containing sensor histidine kinase [Phyllobacterium phragmitis]PRD45996.1 histidine kinase [Phyllobacterium phragmitis]
MALVVVATVISTLYREASERSFQRLLSAHLFSLVGAVSVSPDGELQGRPELGEIRYSSPLSGWYWSVEPVSDNLKGRLESPSLADHVIPQMPLAKVPFDQSFTRTYTEKGLKNEELSVVETEVVLDAANRVARFRVMGNLSEVKKEIRDFRNTLYTYLGIFGLGSILINAAIILFGLRPLDKVRGSLADIREGRSTRVDGTLPLEIAPLAQEMNALIENNRRIVERSRTQVGNLAHSLKTPLSVLVNEGRSIGGKKGRVVVEQSQAMQVQVQHYLQRARIAAQRDSVVFRTPVVPVLERMIRVTAKLNPAHKITFDNNLPNAIFAGEREDFEEIIGNLMENAGKWGRSMIKVSLSPAVFEAKADMLPHAGFEVLIEDNGPGLAQEKIKDALMRGHRLDETKPGTGLGLSIVQDTVREYGGTLKLEKSSLGGLGARIVLPLVEN